MKNIFIVLLAIMLLAGCSAREKSEKVEYKKITASEAKALIDSKDDIVILDVRTKEEFDGGHIKNAILIPDNEIKYKAETTLYDKNEMILVYCRSGRRSELACKELISKGYTNVIDFGGLNKWKYDIVK